MAPIDILDEFRAREANLPDNINDVGLTEFMTNFTDQLKNKYNFSIRQISWTIKMYINEKRIEFLLDELDALDETASYDSVENTQEITTRVKEIAELEAKNQIMACFDQNLRLNLKDVLTAANIDEERQYHILYEIFGFNPTQFVNPQDQVSEFSTELAPYLDSDKPNLQGWELGLDEGFQDIMETYGPVFTSVLNNFLDEDQIFKLFNTSFGR